MVILWNMLFSLGFLQNSCYCQIEMPPLSKSMDEDLAEAAKEVEVRVQTIIS
jgi:hypothetical protein